ncbi:hypothetical protein G7Y89_g4051 [Cudoniella acicularis]|uniref:DUF7905 domain-containing protein n=1 Tax=Cudoniella acicularis TaxID=354080 RepID=A0A8H4RRF2_9HELO|nr:hypothetical protein G7Y89_g4051 [Cudoniella acicularis]
MPPLRDYERTNARQWDESTVGDPTEDLNLPIRNDPLRQQPQPQPQPPAPQTPRGEPARYPAPSRNPPLPNGRVPPERPQSSAPRVESPRKAKSSFAKPEGLVTTRKAITRQLDAQKAEYEQLYLGDPHGDVQLAAIGHYAWPNKYSTPAQLFGTRLEDLDYIRKTFKVWIRWDANLESLQASSPRNLNAQQNVTEAIVAIRQSYHNAKARKISASPLFIMVPPTTAAIQSVVRPKKNEGVVTLELTGGRLSTPGQRDWESKRALMLEQNQKKFRDHLVDRLLAVATMKGWMRMRVHFGHLNLTKYPPEFAKGECNFQGFLKVLDNPRAQASAVFDRKLPDPTSVMKLKQKIIDMSSYTGTFCTLNGDVWGTENVSFQDTMCFFFRNSQNIDVRIEADIDRSTEGEYQIGTIRHFLNNARNKFIEIFSIDVEKKIDWALEVITDNTIREPDSSWRELVEGSVTAKTRQRKDSLGLLYPGITPQGPWGIEVETVVLRSVIKYRLKNSGYVIEICVYRSWQRRDTAGEPTVQASVSMYHGAWDDETVSIEGTTNVRNWDANLSQFFNEGTEETHGIEGFLREVTVIQDLLRTP